MPDINSQDRWLQIYTWFENYHLAREAFIDALRKGDYPTDGQMEICYCEAGKLLFQMMGAKPLPTLEEVNKKP